VSVRLLPETSAYLQALSLCVGVIMRKLYRTLASRTRSDERALGVGILALVLSVLAVAVFQHFVA